MNNEIDPLKNDYLSIEIIKYNSLYFVISYQDSSRDLYTKIWEGRNAYEAATVMKEAINNIDRKYFELVGISNTNGTNKAIFRSVKLVFELRDV